MMHPNTPIPLVLRTPYQTGSGPPPPAEDTRDCDAVSDTCSSAVFFVILSDCCIGRSKKRYDV
jgi:hypothetical protein